MCVDSHVVMGLSTTDRQKYCVVDNLSVADFCRQSQQLSHSAKLNVRVGHPPFYRTNYMP